MFKSRQSGLVPSEEHHECVSLLLAAPAIDVNSLPWDVFSRVGLALSSALAAYAESGTTASFLVPEWPSASWYPMLKRFRLDATYDVGSEVITHEGLDGAVPSRHPMVVLRLAGPLETGLSRAQRHAAQRCLGKTWSSQTREGTNLDCQAPLRRAGRIRSSVAVAA